MTLITLIPLTTLMTLMTLRTLMNVIRSTTSQQTTSAMTRAATRRSAIPRALPIAPPPQWEPAERAWRTFMISGCLQGLIVWKALLHLIRSATNNLVHRPGTKIGPDKHSVGSVLFTRQWSMLSCELETAHHTGQTNRRLSLVGLFTYQILKKAFLL